ERAFMERAAINAPIQGSAADIIRRAMVRMDDALAAAKLNTAIARHDSVYGRRGDSAGHEAGMMVSVS
ncbi:MAG: hypothetical protein J0H89_09875, partial [Rhizobiales bacterium]|nr:hypothetical protein [Hyphomicrobiales bacterium]